ncbi:MAG TPA: FAD-binding oxidoreductase [Chloroflexota bacterium]|jgi:sarcosine oxidase subunit beta|nr:FAD-binding oxidoreductase [Chloroflexota bacterium]
MATLPATADIAIIGAGAIGCSIAYHLGKRGVKNVVVLERDAIGSGTTSKAAGGIRAQFSTPVEIEFSLASLDFFHRFSDEMGGSCDFREHGYLYCLTSQEQLDRYTRDVELQRSMGIDVQMISPDDARALVPGLNTHDVLAATWGPRDGYAGVNEVVQAYARRARELGVLFCEGTTVTDLRLDGPRVESIITTEGLLSAGVVIDAAGPQAAAVGRMIGAVLPVYPRRRHIFVTDDFEGVQHPVPMVQDRGSGFYARSEMRSLLMSPGDAEDVGELTDAPPVDWGRLEETVQKAVRRMPALGEAGIRSAWAGLRPLTPDEHGIIDQMPGVDNMLAAVGFCGHGFQHSPAIGMSVAELIVDGHTSIDIAPLGLARFSTGVKPMSDVPEPD